MSALRDQLLPFFKSYQRVELPQSRLVRAAVLVAILERGGQPYFLLTKRTEDVEHHKGQVSFPGGAMDATDPDLVATALRETDEEIGLSADRIVVAGLFDDIIVPTGFIVTPVVGFIEDGAPLNLNKSEVDSILEVPFSFFQDERNKKTIQMMRSGELRDVYFFGFGEVQIWGATAFIIDSFLKKARGALEGAAPSAPV